MKRIICIGECTLDVIFRNASPIGSMPGGRIVNASAILARAGMPVVLAGELAQGPVGDIISDFLRQAGVDMSSLDRFNEGLTPLVVYTIADNGETIATRYENYPDECFDIVWPRIDEGDIVVFGGFYALDDRMRPRMLQLLTHAAERKAVLVYLPGFMPQQQPRITRVMPAILENLELASIIIARDYDLSNIFGADSDERCFRNHIDFYCRSLVSIDSAKGSISYFSGCGSSSLEISGHECKSLIWNAGAVAGIVDALYSADKVLDRLDAPDEQFRMTVISQAVKKANEAVGDLSAEWQKSH